MPGRSVSDAHPPPLKANSPSRTTTDAARRMGGWYPRRLPDLDAFGIGTGDEVDARAEGAADARRFPVGIQGDHDAACTLPGSGWESEIGASSSILAGIMVMKRSRSAGNPAHARLKGARFRYGSMRITIRVCGGSGST